MYLVKLLSHRLVGVPICSFCHLQYNSERKLSADLTFSLVISHCKVVQGRYDYLRTTYRNYHTSCQLATMYNIKTRSAEFNDQTLPSLMIIKILMVQFFLTGHLTTKALWIKQITNCASVD